MGKRGSYSVPRTTANADTAFAALLWPRPQCLSRLTSLTYRTQGTAHQPTVMKVASTRRGVTPAFTGQTTFSAAALANQAVINLTADPAGLTSGGVLAAGQYLAWEATDGTFQFGKILSVATLAVTLTANLSVAVAAGGKVWCFGSPTETFHFPLDTLASTVLPLTDQAGGLCVSNNFYEPLLIYSGNATASGFLEQATVVHETA